MISQLYFDKVKKYFNGDMIKTWEWFKNPHPRFGMLSPFDMIELKRENKVIKLINELDRRR